MLLGIVEGGTCFETSNCIEHADCVKEANEDLTGECTCNDGYTFKQSTSSCDSPSGKQITFLINYQQIIEINEKLNHILIIKPAGHEYIMIVTKL